MTMAVVQLRLVKRMIELTYASVDRVYPPRNIIIDARVRLEL
jgi:hypothetical protein